MANSVDLLSTFPRVLRYILNSSIALCPSSIYNDHLGRCHGNTSTPCNSAEGREQSILTERIPVPDKKDRHDQRA